MTQAGSVDFATAIRSRLSASVSVAVSASVSVAVDWRHFVFEVLAFRGRPVQRTDVTAGSPRTHLICIRRPTATVDGAARRTQLSLTEEASRNTTNAEETGVHQAGVLTQRLGKPAGRWKYRHVGAGVIDSKARTDDTDSSTLRPPL